MQRGEVTSFFRGKNTKAQKKDYLLRREEHETHSNQKNFREKKGGPGKRNNPVIETELRKENFSKSCGQAPLA